MASCSRPMRVLSLVGAGIGSLLAIRASSSSSAQDCQTAFAFGSATGAARPLCIRPSAVSRQSASAAGDAAGSPAAVSIATCALVAGAVAAMRRQSRIARAGTHTYERKWWSIEETEDPTTLPVWQRDYRYAYQVLKRTMVESRKKGQKVFWDVRVIKSETKGCKVEMLNSGLIGWCPLEAEGPERLEVGSVVQMECTACPQQRVDKESRHSPWPKMGGKRRAQPYFSHWLWLEQQAAIKKAQDMEKGTIVEGTVYKHIAKGLIIKLEGENDPKGMLDMSDISRVCSHRKYVQKMFPVGTQMKCFVAHADKENGRITLSTKEFEDDDHVGWMMNFPERCFEKADEYVERYHEKRDAYIAMLQK